MKKILSIFLSLTITLSLCSCSLNPNVGISANAFCFDTVITITVYGNYDKSILNPCLEMCNYYEGLLSPSIETSDVYKINHSSENQIEVSKETAYLLENALTFAKMSNGLYDPTVYPLSDLWHFSTNTDYVPDEEAIQEALKLIDYTSIHVEGTTVIKDNPNTQIDLGSIAKGYIADMLKDCLINEYNVKSALINLGGNVLTIGSKPDGNPFNIGIKDPFGSEDPIITIKTGDKSVVTSGIYERCFEKDGILYHHILDTKTGHPVKSDLVSVSIICDSSMNADALSTALFLIGEKNSTDILRAFNAEAYFIYSDASVSHVY